MSKAKVRELDEYVQQNYNIIKRSANTICQSYTNGDVDDIINDTYLKLRAKILRDSFDGTNYGGYFFVSLRNTYGMTLRKKQRDKTVYINDIHFDNVDYTHVVEKVLIEQEEMIRSSQQYDNDLMDITKDLFEYVELIFDERDAYLFKNYYLTPKSTYRKLSERTDFSISECSTSIKMMKKRIRSGFIEWYKTKYND